MDTVIKVSDQEIPINLFEATVIHANKYSETSGGWFNLPVTSTLYSDIVFRLHEFGKDCQVRTKNIDLPVYTNQEVTLISSNSIILGFIDNQTKKYYYTVSDFSKRLGFGFPFYWFLLLAILSALLTYYFSGKEITVLVLSSFLVWILLYYIQKIFWNYRIRKSIDQYLQS